MNAGRVLIVDDERFFRDLYQEMIASRGHTVRVAASAGEAMSLLGAERFDVLVADIVMPETDGIALVRDARARWPDLEAVAVTGREDVRVAVQAMKAGFADFLTKPVDRQELLEVVERALERVRLRREHSALLEENLQFVKSQSLFRQCAAVLGTLDLERLQELALSVLARATDAQGAALWIAEEKGELTLRAYRGVVDRAALPPRIDPRADELGPPVRAGAPFPAPGRPPGEAFFVPLAVDEEPVGLALLTDRASGPFAPEDHATALAVADFAAIAVRNARRFQALERLGLRDRETAAYNLSYFVDYAGKEFYKARRYGRQFSLVVVSVDNLDQMRRAAGRDLFRCATRDIVEAIGRATRDADVIAKVSDNEYYVLLPETDHFGALTFQRRAAEEVRKEDSVITLEERVPVLLSMGAATFPKDGEDFDELLHWCRARVADQRGSLVRRLHLGDLPENAFWELVDLLLEAGSRLPESSPSAQLPANPGLFAAVQREAAREVARDPRARGLLFVGGPSALASDALGALPAGEGMARAGDEPTRVYLLGPRGGGEAPSHPLVTPVVLDGDDRIAGCEFLLLHGENASYALVQEPGGRLFHSSDAPLVASLVAKLQALYDLQPM
jgi:diguanylate cyclase (GGDEF)-like protein